MSGTDPQGDSDPERVDDDALADAILSIYTSSIPVQQPPSPSPTPPTTPPSPPTTPSPPSPPSAPPTPPSPPSSTPSSPVTDGPRVWDLDDLPSSIPVAPPPPAPAAATSNPVPPVSPPPEPAPSSDGRQDEPQGVELGPDGEPWTRLVESGEPDGGAVRAHESEWAPPVWQPEATPAPAQEAADPDLTVYSEVVVDPSRIERMQDDLAADQAPPDGEAIAPAPVEPPAAPPGGAIRREPTPWFDLDAAPPPRPGVAPRDRDDEPERGAGVPAGTATTDAATTATAAPEPEAADADPVGAESANTADPLPTDDDERLPTIAPLPAGTVVTTPLPAAAVPAHGAPEPTPAPDPAPAEDGAPRLPEVLPAESPGAEPTRLDQRAGRSARLFWLWFGANASLVSVAAGGVLFASGMSPRQAIIAAVLGLALSFLPLGVTALAGTWTGQPTLVVSRAAFGHIGNLLPSLLAVITRAGWGGVLIALGAASVHAALVRLGVAPDGPIDRIGAAAVLGGVAVVLGALGYGLLSRVQFVIGAVTGVLAVGTTVLTAGRIRPDAALSVPDGPWILLVSGAVIVFAIVGTAWAQSGADFARYQARGSRGSSSVVSASAGAALPALLLVAWGALLAASSRDTAGTLAGDPAGTIIGLVPDWAVVPLLVLLVLGAVAGSSIAGYSGGFALLATGLPLRRPVAALLSGVLVAAVGIALSLPSTVGADWLDVVTTLAVPTAAWVGIFAAEMLLRTRRFHTASLVQRDGVYPDVRVGNLIAFVVVAAASFGFTSAKAAGLDWQGWFFPMLGIPRADPVAQSDVGILIALALGLVVPLVGSLGTVRRQETLRV